MEHGKCVQCPEIKVLAEIVKIQGEDIRKLENSGESIHSLAQSVAVMAEKLGNMNTSMKEKITSVEGKVDSVAASVEQIKLQPGEDLRHYKRSVVVWIIIGVLAFVAGIITKGAV